jgi:lipopolysaccharide biosynthesis regulator YciM
VQILAITTARDACVTGNLDAAEELLTQDIHTDADDYTSYAHRSFIMSRKNSWDLALEDAIKVSCTDTSWPSYSILAFMCDIVYQHSVLIDRLHLQRHRSLRKRPRPGGKDSV